MSMRLYVCTLRFATCQCSSCAMQFIRCTFHFIHGKIWFSSKKKIPKKIENKRLHGIAQAEHIISTYRIFTIEFVYQPLALSLSPARFLLDIKEYESYATSCYITEIYEYMKVWEWKTRKKYMGAPTQLISFLHIFTLTYSYIFSNIHTLSSHILFFLIWLMAHILQRQYQITRKWLVTWIYFILYNLKLSW